MSQQVQELINKIKAEGVQQAEARAGEIEQQARKQAEKIVNDAKLQAEQLISKAKYEQKKFEESTRAALKQAARDTLLDLKKEIEAILARIISSEVKGALSADKLADLINEIAKGFLKQESDAKDITVTVSQASLKKLKDGFVDKLKEGIKQPIHLQAADDIEGGFTISFDGGRSSFDFTDTSLVEYLSDYLNAEVSSLLKESISSE